ncbi:hypothetical protein ACHAWF_013492 [Thalassiosira exigua]
MSPDGNGRRRRRRSREASRHPCSLRCSLLSFLSILSHVTSATPAASLASGIDYRYFVAGGSCAAISHGITTPIDVVKTRMQSDPEKYRGLLPATATIVREEGASALCKGLGPTLVGYGIEGALKFGIYEVAKPLVVGLCRKAKTRLKAASVEGGVCGGPLPFVVASIMAGAVASLVLVPMESTRIRMVTDDEFAELGLLGGLRRLVDEAGLARTLSVGLGAMLAKQVPYTYGKQVSFDVVAKSLYRILNAPRPAATTLAESLSKSVGPDTIKWMVSVLSAMVASVMACLFSQPGDVILTETYKGGDEGDGEKASRSLGEVSATIYARRGDRGAVRALSGFFTGLQARFVHVGVIITSQLVIYDLVKQLLGLPATGAH